MSKYKAKPIVIDNIRFASQKEGRRYQELRLLEKAGEIRGLELQPKLEIHVAQRYAGWNYPRKVCEYRGDFRYQERFEKPPSKRGKAPSMLPTIEWREVVEDVKGFKTPVYRLKKKMVEAQYGIEIREI